jgi:hypothetical protein
LLRELRDDTELRAKRLNVRRPGAQEPEELAQVVTDAPEPDRLGALHEIRRTLPERLLTRIERHERRGETMFPFGDAPSEVCDESRSLQPRGILLAASVRGRSHTQ